MKSTKFDRNGVGNLNAGSILKVGIPKSSAFCKLEFRQEKLSRTAMEDMHMEDQLPWVRQETKLYWEHMEAIAQRKDFEKLFALTDNGDFSIVLLDILSKKYDERPDSLSPVQLDLFLCMKMENCGQSGSILTFLQEWYPQYHSAVVSALARIGAGRSSEIIRQAVELLPSDGSWFFLTSDEASEALMDALDRDFSGYPDGSMSTLVRKYAEEHRAEIEFM